MEKESEAAQVPVDTDALLKLCLHTGLLVAMVPNNAAQFFSVAQKAEAKALVDFEQLGARFEAFWFKRGQRIVGRRRQRRMLFRFYQRLRAAGTDTYLDEFLKGLARGMQPQQPFRKATENGKTETTDSASGPVARL